MSNFIFIATTFIYQLVLLIAEFLDFEIISEAGEWRTRQKIFPSTDITFFLQ